MRGTQSDHPFAASQVDHLAAALANKAGGISQARLSALELHPGRFSLERLLLAPGCAGSGAGGSASPATHGTRALVTGRPSLTRQLAAWMNGERVGEWRLPGPGPQEFVCERG